MLTKRETNGRGFVLGMFILVLGIVIGALARPDQWLSVDGGGSSGGGERDAPRRIDSGLLPADEPAPSPDNGLDTLSITISPESARIIQAVVERAKARGVIQQEAGDTVPATVRFRDKEIAADIRIKGDWTDHIRTRKWSLRIKLKDDKLLGMSVFSIQNPLTRGWMWEWLTLAMMRREGVLAPRSTFVNVSVNGNPTSIYFLEEHFSKELLESQQRREGPIVLWDESSHWAANLQHHKLPDNEIELPTPFSASRVHTVAGSSVRAYGERRLSSIETLSRSLFSATQKMDQLRDLALQSIQAKDQLRLLEALDNVQGEAVETLVDVDRLACCHALATVLQIQHSLIWHNMRFYHNPVINRLEPISFDNMTHQAAGRAPVMLRAGTIMREFGKSTAYYNGVFRYLARFCEPGYLDEVMEDLEPELRVFEAALDAEERLTPGYRVDDMLQRLRTQQAFLQDVLYPATTLRFSSAAEFEETAGGENGPVFGTLIVRAWSTTETPVVVDGFEFTNGVRLDARPYLAEEDEPRVSYDGGSGVVLPYDGRVVTFRFPMDARLTNLENVQQIKDAARQQADAGGTLDFDVVALHRPLAAQTLDREPLVFRTHDPRWVEEQGRPQAPTLDELLARHPFLTYRPEKGRLVCKRGTFRVDGDLVVPADLPLEIPSGVRLRFEPDAVLLSEAPLLFTGTAANPVILEPVDGADRWRGVIVLEADGRSEWTHVTIRSTDAISRAGWVVTGGITFYHSPVTMRDCLIEGTWAEDGTNIFGCDFLMERVTFLRCVSDSFDGDFVTGTVRECVFKEGLADGVDFSGSDVDVVDCQFLDMGDKAVSAGEDSVVRVTGGLADGVSIGIAAKDRSRVTAQGMTINDARNYALAVFIKKREFGPAELRATGLVIRESGLGDTIVQTGCTLEVDGELVPTQDLDVQKLYREKILGQ
jgi:hypothetical protein